MLTTTTTKCLIGGVLLVLAVSAVPAGAGISDVKVTTDRSIDCSSIKTIARDLYAPCKTDQDKAIATWYFVRRMHFHWPNIPTWDSIDLINSYGFALCGYQSTMYTQIAQAGGLKARTMHLPGHVIAEVFYDDAWHMFDCQVGWYALNREGKVASCAEMKADPTLVTKAEEEKRASQPYFQCRDNPQGGTNYAAKASAGGSPKVPDNVISINLRRGESITRVWGNESKPWFSEKGNDGKPNTTFLEPRHTCTGQGIDTNDPVNWPYWRPYAQVTRVADGKPSYGIKRTYGNGRLVYAPNLAGAEFLADLPEGSAVNVKAIDQGLTAAEGGKEASVVIPVNSPYIITDASLTVSAEWGETGVLTIAVKGEKGEWSEVFKGDNKGMLKDKVFSLKDAAFRGKKYQVKVAMQCPKAEVVLSKLELTTVFINNMYALPYFMPGKNFILVTADMDEFRADLLTSEHRKELNEYISASLKDARAAADKDIAAGLLGEAEIAALQRKLRAMAHEKAVEWLQKHLPDRADLGKGLLTLKYVWEEAGKEKTLEKTIEKLPFEATVEVGGQELPKMKSVTLSVAP